MCSALRFCLSVYLSFSPCAMMHLLGLRTRMCAYIWGKDYARRCYTWHLRLSANGLQTDAGGDIGIVDGQHLTVAVACLRGEQPEDEAGRVGRVTQQSAFLIATEALDVLRGELVGAAAANLGLHLGVDNTGPDRVDAHAAVSNLPGEDSGHGLHTGFGRRVRAPAGGRTAGRTGGDIDDSAPATLQHAGESKAAGEKDALEIDGDVVTPGIGLGIGQDGDGRDHARAVDHAVHRPGSREERAHFVHAADVARNRLGRAGARPTLLGHRLDLAP